MLVQRLLAVKDDTVLLFLSGLPIWAGLFLLVLLPSIIAMGALIVSRRFVGFGTLASNNEIAGFKFATVGVIYSVLVAFAVIVVWEKFNEAEAAVIQEAGAAATLYRLTATQAPATVATRAALNKYLELAIQRDWPAMAQEKESQETTQALDALYSAALKTRKGSSPPAVLIETFKQLDALTTARRTRLHLATGVVPGVVWLVLSFGAVLTVSFTFFFGTKNLPAQVMMTGILSVLVFMALFVIVSIDHPFTGPSNVGSEPLQSVMDEDFAR